MEMRTSNAPLDARLGLVWTEEGEGASVPSALPRREPVQIVLRDSSEREETSGIRSQYMQDEVNVERLWDARAVTPARVEIMTSMCPREAAVRFAHPRTQSAPRAR